VDRCGVPSVGWGGLKAAAMADLHLARSEGRLFEAPRSCVFGVFGGFGWFDGATGLSGGCGDFVSGARGPLGVAE
jgi:hypothetical protein